MSNSNQEFKQGDFAWYWAFDARTDEARRVLVISTWDDSDRHAEVLDLTSNRKIKLLCSTLAKTKEEIEYAMDHPMGTGPITRQRVEPPQEIWDLIERLEREEKEKTE